MWLTPAVEFCSSSSSAVDLQKKKQKQKQKESVHQLQLAVRVYDAQTAALAPGCHAPCRPRRPHPASHPSLRQEDTHPRRRPIRVRCHSTHQPIPGPSNNTATSSLFPHSLTQTDQPPNQPTNQPHLRTSNAKAQARPTTAQQSGAGCP